MLDSWRAPARDAVGPVAVWAVAGLLAAGLLGPALGVRGHAPPVVAVVAGLAAAGLAVPGPQRRRAALALVAVGLVAAGLGGLRIARVEAGGLPALAAARKTAAVSAVVATEPRSTARGWWTLVRVEQAGDRRMRERALLRGEGEPPPLGSRWSGRASLRPLDREGFHAFLRRQHAAVEIRPVAWEPAGEPGLLARASEHVRSRLRDAATVALPDPHAGLAVGLVTGDKRLLSPGLEEAMRDTGLTHLIVVSGSKVAILVAGVYALTALTGLGAGARRRVLLAAVLWYAFVARWEPSVLRATAMVLVFLLAAARGHLTDPRHALAAALLLLVLVDPGLAGSVGLLLSAGATAGVLIVAPLVRRRLEWLPARLPDLLAVTLGAQVGVAPPLLLAFGELPTASIPANLVAVPAATVASALVFAAATLASIHPILGVPLLAAARPFVAVILDVSDRFRWWGGAVDLQRPLTVAAGVAVTVWLLSQPRSTRARMAGAAAALALVAALVPIGLARLPVTTLTVTAIDVGRGDAFLVEAPGARLLFDGGPDTTAARWLRANGRRDLDVVVASHAHTDHVGGLPAVVRHHRVGAVWTPTVPTELAAMAELADAAHGRGVPVHHPVAGDVAAIGEMLVEVLGPPPQRPYRWTDSEVNNTSIVLRVTWRDRVALLTGDIEQAAQRDLLAAPERLRAGVLAVPHHGAATSEPDFLLAAAAPIGLISTARDNPYGHPRPEVVDLLEGAGTRVYVTFRHGTTRVEVPPLGQPAVARGSQPTWDPAAALACRLPATVSARSSTAMMVPS